MPCGLISTTTTFAIGFPLASLTLPVIATVVGRGLLSFSTGDVSSDGAVTDTGVESGVAVGAGSGVVEAGGASGEAAGVGSGVPGVAVSGVAPALAGGD